MPFIKPFKAIRPDSKYADKMISLPYDVMNRKEATAMAQDNPYSFLHICRSEIDLPEEENPYSQKVYRKARQNIEAYLADGVLIQDEEPCFYLYRQIMNGNVQTGITACVSIDEYLDDTIKKHELTRVEKERDRIEHFDACNANTEPVFLTYRDNPDIRKITEDWALSHSPEYQITTADGVEHIIWKISGDQVIEELIQLFAGVDNFYIADGHHRSASAAKVGLRRREANPGYKGDEEFNSFMAVIFPDKDLHIFDYNRAVKDLNSMSPQEFLEKLSECFEIQQLPPGIQFRPDQKHVFGLYISGNWYRLAAKPSIVPGDIIGGLDVSILQSNVFSPLLGIEDPRTDSRIDFIGGIRGLAELERRVDSGWATAFALYPVTMDDLLEVSDTGNIMPPKSTWFEPKLGSGLFIHELN